MIYLSVDIRQKITDCPKAEKSYGNISVRLEVQKSTVLSFINEFAKFGVVETMYSNDRLKQKSLESIARKLCCEINIKNRVVLADIAWKIDAEGNSVSKRTV